MREAETTQDGLTPSERKFEADYRKLMAVWGQYESIQRLVRKMSKPSTRVSYLFMLQQYFRWLREAKGVTMDPEALILDNLKAAYESSATDVKRRRRHGAENEPRR
jgi:hypothetical protein